MVDAKAKADRYDNLLKQNAIAPQDYDDAKAAYLTAKANADSARINLDYTRITSPITGRIGASTVTEGALVAAQQATALDHRLDARSHLCRCGPVQRRTAGAQARRHGRQRQFRADLSPPKSR